MLIDEIEEYKSSKGYSDEKVINALAHVIEDHGCDCVEKAIKHVHEAIYGQHFNEKLADKVVKEFFYVDSDGDKIKGPFITREKAKSYYSTYNRQLTDNNFNDFYVALNKVISDHKKLISKWFEDESEVMEKCVELTLSCINDDDYSTKGCKVWNHINNDYLQ